MILRNAKDALLLPKGTLEVVTLGVSEPKVEEYRFSDDEVISSARSYLIDAHELIQFDSQAEVVAVAANSFGTLGPKKIASSR